MYDKSKIKGVKNCSYCGKEFYVYTTERLKKEKVCCSVYCANELRKKEGLNRECVICGKRFHRSAKYLADRKQPLTCSVECMGKLRKTIYKGNANPNFDNRGSKNPMFAGEEYAHAKYLWTYCPNHPFKVGGAGDRVRTHRLVAEKFLLNDVNSVEINGKRYLSPEYDVHHIDFDKYNNNPNNLMVLTRAEHMRLHRKLKRGVL